MFNKTYAVAGLYPVTAREEVGTYHVLFTFRADSLTAAKALFIGYTMKEQRRDEFYLLCQGKPVEVYRWLFQQEFPV